MFAGIGGFRAGLDRIGGFSASAIVRSTSTPTPATAPSTTSERRNDTIPTPEKSTQTTCPTSNSCAGDSPARHFQMLAEERDLKMPEALSSLRSPAWLKPDDLRIFCLRTFQDCLRMTRAGRFLPSSPRLMTWGTAWNGWCLTARISVSPRSESGCSLSDILIPDAPEKYFLSSEQTEKLLYKSSAGRRDRESMTPEGPPVHRLPEVEEKE